MDSQEARGYIVEKAFSITSRIRQEAEMPTLAQTRTLSAEHLTALILTRDAAQPITLAELERATAARGLRSPLGDAVELLFEAGLVDHPDTPQIDERTRRPRKDARRYICTLAGETEVSGPQGRVIAGLKARIAAASPSDEQARLSAMLELLVSRLPDASSTRPPRLQPEEFTAEEQGEADAQEGPAVKLRAVPVVQQRAAVDPLVKARAKLPTVE